MLLAGGLGTRMREETEFRPKPMVEIGGKPVLWHIMKTFSTRHHDFVVCTGYKGDMIKEYFLNYEARNNDFTITWAARRRSSSTTSTSSPTGRSPSPTPVRRPRPVVASAGSALRRGRGALHGDLRRRTCRRRHPKLLAFHEGARPGGDHHDGASAVAFGLVESTTTRSWSRFRRSRRSTTGSAPATSSSRGPSSTTSGRDDLVLEQEPLAGLAGNGELVAYRHDGWWQPMDTYRESRCSTRCGPGEAPWKVW